MKTNDEDFKKFQDEITRWIEVFGLHEWDCSFDHEQLGKGTWAQCDSQHEGHSAVFSLNTDVDAPKAEDPQELGLHEAVELLLADMETLAESRSWDANTWEAARHMVVNRIVSFIKRTEFWKQHGGESNSTA